MGIAASVFAIRIDGGQMQAYHQILKKAKQVSGGLIDKNKVIQILFRTKFYIESIKNGLT